MKTVIVPEDRKYIVDRPSPGFSPARTTAIIEQVIKDHDAELERRDRAWQAKADERIDMAASYLMRREQGMEKSVEAYFGRENLHKAWGEAFAEKLRIHSQLYRKTGKVKKILL